MLKVTRKLVQGMLLPGSPLPAFLPLPALHLFPPSLFSSSSKGLLEQIFKSYGSRGKAPNRVNVHSGLNLNMWQCHPWVLPQCLCTATGLSAIGFRCSSSAVESNSFFFKKEIPYSLQTCLPSFRSGAASSMRNACSWVPPPISRRTHSFV